MITTSPLVKTYTVEEFWELPQLPGHDKLELIAGVLYITSPPANLHSNIISRLVRLVVDYQANTHDQGVLYVPRAGIVKTPNTWIEPDLFYVASETEARLDPNYPQYFSTADLIIEVISPSSAIYDRNTKADTYTALGVKELWLVDEASGIIELRLLDGDSFGPSLVFERDDYLKSVVLPGFEVKVSRVFDD
jgi:Uma2 family endonuclease